LGWPQAIALNVSNMVGIGPFVTIPLFISAMNGPQALIAWVIAAVLVICDGLVWSELGAALPGSGGTYHFLREIFGKSSSNWGRLLPFLFVWQFLVSGTMEIASGYTGAMPYVEYIWPNVVVTYRDLQIPGGTSSLAAACCLVVTWLLSRRIDVVGWLGVMFGIGTVITVLTIIVAGLLHFDASLLTFPPDAFEINPTWVRGLGAAMLIAIYDYFGYYNICHLGEEVREPGRTIPRAVIGSVVLVAVVYLIMNLSIIAVVPWQEAMNSKEIASLFMETLFGRNVAVLFTGLILWTALACMFAITLGYSRIPYAAALNGDFFPAFGRVHPTKRYPAVSLWTLGGLTAMFCYLPLQLVIEAAVTVRILVQFVAQIIGLHLLRKTRPDVVLPFRMWLYPLPSLLALCGWLFVLGTRADLLWMVSGVLASGVAVFFFFLWKPTPS
jgi:amino acid transporter